ncbi:toxin-antitoxin system YwqK family antitoxin [Robiginitalea biformata]|nr:nicotinic acid mononucleotide adenyltransferase [Robiginitalea biformata]
MYRIMTLLMLICGVISIEAQQPEPQFERTDDLVKATYYHENGAVAQTGFFRDGQLHGEWIMFDTSGKKVAIGQYDAGNKTGKWFFWEEDNLREVDYSDNAIVNVVNWNNGTRVAVNR